jgi:hypothetical protein
VFISYDKKPNGLYANLAISVRNGQKVIKEYQHLGKVLDKDNGIYQSRERGVFTYDLESNSFGKAPEDFVPPLNNSRKEKLIVDFGDIYFLDKFINNSVLCESIDSLGYGNPDTLKSMISYYCLASSANCYAENWWSGSYAHILYPKANLTSQRISDFLSSIGDESRLRIFFDKYIKLLDANGINTGNILIDSSGLHNSIRFPLTAIRNHNGEISDEVRLIYAVQQNTGLPIYFRYCPGNVIDATTLIRCLAELKEQGVNTKFAILDAGYYTDANIKELFESKISFITRMPENRSLYKDLAIKYGPILYNRDNAIDYPGRIIFLKTVKCKLHGYNAYAYIGFDYDRNYKESKVSFFKSMDKQRNAKVAFDAMQNGGLFVLFSSRRLARNKVMPLYYQRQNIEQIFDIGKNYAGMLPLRVHNEDTFRGHLLLTFIATVVMRMLQNQLHETEITPLSLFMILRNQKCKIYESQVITCEPVKKVNDCYKIFGYSCPITIPI